MGAIRVHEFTTVDGVVDAPMWTVDYGFPDDLAASIGAITAPAKGILLGRTTFEMFAPAWSTRTAEDDEGAPFFNDTPKYVVSSTLTEPGWDNSSVLGDDWRARVRALKEQDGGDIVLTGSLTLCSAVIEAGLVDEYRLFVHPAVQGRGRRLFPEGHETALRPQGEPGVQQRRGAARVHPRLSPL